MTPAAASPDALAPEQPMVVPPRLETERLILRLPRLADFDAYAAFFASPRAAFEDGPKSRAEAWKEFASSLGQWRLRGYGAFSIEERATGRYCGETGIYHAATYPEPEIGWILMEHAEGCGVAFEAARAVRDWGYATLGLGPLVSYIAAGNVRSIRLAERLGARLEIDAPACDPGALVYRHPGPEVRAA
jgi:RimJ/RimL family protein N-acetyltransferase